MMKKFNAMLMAAIGLVVSAQSLEAYYYKVANLSPNNMYVDIRFAAKGTGFEGNKNVGDAWKLKGPQLVKAHSTRQFNFTGLFCVQTLLVGPSNYQMKPVYLVKAPEDVKLFDDVVKKVAIVGNTLELGASKVQGPVGLALQSVAASLNQVIGPFAGLFKDTICGDYTFYVAPNPFKITRFDRSKFSPGYYNNYIVIAKSGLKANTAKYTNVAAMINRPQSLPNTPVWKQMKDDIIPAAKAKMQQAEKAAGGKAAFKGAAKEAASGARSALGG